LITANYGIANFLARLAPGWECAKSAQTGVL
jgi:hypothetical protein